MSVVGKDRKLHKKGWFGQGETNGRRLLSKKIAVKDIRGGGGGEGEDRKTLGMNQYKAILEC